MTQNIELDSGDVAIAPFFDAVQEILGAAATSFYLTVTSSTKLKAVAGTGNELNAISIEGRYRWLTSSVEAAHPGGAAGTYNVWVTGSDNKFTAPPTEDETVYAWGLTILATGEEPGTALKRKVGEVDWSGSAITALRHLTGVRRDDAPVFAKAPIKEFTALKVRGAASQSADLVLVENSSGTALLTVGSAGAVTSTAGITDTSAAGITASGAGGKTTLELSNTGANTGLTLGGDATLYRSAAETLKTDKHLIVGGDFTVSGSLSLPSGSIGSGPLAENSVTASEIAEGVVGVSELEDDAKATIIASEQSRESASYGTLTTADKVEGVVLPTKGLIYVAYTALWKESVQGAGRAAIFIGADQLKIGSRNGAPLTEAALITPHDSSPAKFGILHTDRIGLISPGDNSLGNASLVTTGMAMASVQTGSKPVKAEIGGSETVVTAKDPVENSSIASGGVCAIFAAAGTYDVSVQFKATSGSVTAKERRLYVWVKSFA